MKRNREDRETGRDREVSKKGQSRQICGVKGTGRDARGVTGR